MNIYIAVAVPPQNYVATEESGYFGYTTEAFIYMSHERDGSKEYPFDINHGTGTDTVYVAEGGTVWLDLNVHASFDGTKFVLTVNSSNAQFKIYYNDTDNNGVIDENDTPYGMSELIGGKAVYTFTDNGKAYVIALSTVNGEAEELEYVYASVAAEEGETPDSAKEFTETGALNETASAGQTVYYRYTGDIGKLTVTLTGEGVSLKTVEFANDGEYTLTDVSGNTLVVDDTMGMWVYFAVVVDSDSTYEISVEVE